MTETAEGHVSVIVLARPQSSDGDGDELLHALGETRANAMRKLQFTRAHAWATAGFTAETVAVRDGGLAELIAQTGSIGADDVLVVAAPELSSWRTDLGHAALDDLRAGCVLSIGPIFDGGLYLLAATGVGLELLRGDGDGDGAADAVDLTGPAAMATLVGLAEPAGIEVGLLRTERGLRSAGDLRALLADPLTDGELRKLLNADWGEGT